MGRLEEHVRSDARNPEKQILMVHFLQNAEIDRVAWDKAITSSRQSLIYGMSWYLDLVSPGWCGLAEDGYTAVMPLTVKKKYGVSYLIQPLYTQQLGIFSGDFPAEEKISEFIAAIPLKFKYISLNLNFGNSSIPTIFSAGRNKDYVLNLENDYNSLIAAYSENTRRNLQKAKNLTISFDGRLNDLTRLKAENTSENRINIPTKTIQNFVSEVMNHDAGFICSGSFEDSVCASVFFLHFQKRIYYLIPVSNPTGKDKKAMFAIIDSVIRKFAGTPAILDFEGSNIPGIARFFEGFGAVNQQYPALKINNLPFPLNKLLKS